MLNSIVNGFPSYWLVGGAILFFLLALLGARLISPHNKLPGRAGAPLPMKSLGKMPILQVELARNKSDLEQVFTPGDLMRNIQDARVGNTLNTFLFIPSYLGFLICIGLLLARGDLGWPNTFTLVALALVLLAAICDWLENSGISKVLHKLDAQVHLEDRDATRISTPSFIKWTTLAIVLLVYGVAAFRMMLHGRLWLVIIATPGIVLGALIAYTLTHYAIERWGIESAADPETARNAKQVQADEIEEVKGLRVSRLVDLTLSMLDPRYKGELKVEKKVGALHDLLRDFWKGDATSLHCLESYQREPTCDNRRALQDALTAAVEEKHLAHKISAWVGATDPFRQGYVGLALSGGGIRSATFNLGVLQSLANLNVLGCVDYLSTVSGGGYIGSWLIAWLRRRGFGTVSRQLRPDWNEHGGEEPPEIEFLRSFSNYLTPQLGLFSADTWSLLAIWARNLLLNLTILVLSISALLLFPRVVVSLSHYQHPSIYWSITVIAMACAVIWTGRNLNLFARRQRQFPRYSLQGAIQWRIVLPTMLASWAGSCWLWAEGQDMVSQSYAWVLWMVWVGAVTYVVWFCAWLAARFFSSRKTQPDDVGSSIDTVKQIAWPPVLVSAFFEGAIGGLLFYELARLYKYWHDHACAYPGNDVHFVAWGTGLVAVIFGLMVAFQIGLLGKAFPDERREWWSRTGAFVTIYSIAWMALFALALYSPLLILWSKTWVRATVTVGWLAHTIIGVGGAKSAKTGEGGPLDSTGVFLKAAPPVFVIGLFALLSFSIYRVLPHQKPPCQSGIVAVKMDLNIQQQSGGKSTTVAASVDSASGSSTPSYGELATAYWPSSVKTDRRTGLRMFGIALLCAALALTLSWRVDINEFSMHLLYRNRLVRCYLGASHQAAGQPTGTSATGPPSDARNPNPFTGFDPADDILLAKFSQKAPLESRERKYAGPYPILNTTLNVTHGKRLAWQERRAESFIFTPLFCGFEVQPDRQPVIGGKLRPLEPKGYRPTLDFLYSEPTCKGGPYLGTAVGISGAAASPNMGYHSSSPLAFLMTVFDVRLGWWAGNTRHWRTWRNRGPKLGLLYLLLELFGSSDDESGYVYLSDGGHFENLGIYELVRRECRLIIACDAGDDEKFTFEDLGNAIRKCRIDFGVDIELPIKSLKPPAQKDGEQSWSPMHWAVGIIHYEKRDATKKPGLLIYVKASMTGEEPSDILEYKNLHPSFPHDTTANQFFTESQFESYRKLGEHIVQKCNERNLLNFVCDPSEWEGDDPEALKKRVNKYNTPPEEAVGPAHAC